MRYRISVASLAIVAVFFMTATSNAQKKLRWKAQAGDRFHVVLNAESKQAVTIGPQTIEVPNSFLIEQVWTIKNVDEQGNFRIEAEVNRGMIEAKTPLGKVKYDSASKEKPAGQLGPLFAGIIKPLIGMKTKVTMSDRGKLTDFKSDPAAKKIQAAPGIGQAIKPGAVAQVLMGVSPEFPASLAPGDKWETSTENASPDGATMKLSNTYTYAGEEKKDGATLDRINVKSEVEQKGTVKSMGMEMKIVDQDNTGKTLFDNQAGHLVLMEMTQKLNMETEAPGGQKMTVAGTTKTTVTFKKLKPGEQPAGLDKNEDDTEEKEDPDAIIID